MTLHLLARGLQSDGGQITPTQREFTKHPEERRDLHTSEEPEEPQNLQDQITASTFSKQSAGEEHGARFTWSQTP